MEHSKFQLAIFDAVLNGNKNIAVNAVAGSGKTTTIVDCCKQIRGLRKQDVKFLAFNKSIVSELKVKIGDKADVSTLHSFGLSVILKAIPRLDFKKHIQSTKYNKIIREQVDSRVDAGLISKKEAIIMTNNITRLFALCRANLLEYNDMQGIEGIVEEHNIEVIGAECSIVNDLLKDCYKALDPNNPVIDYTDMIALPIMAYKRYIPTYKLVFIDEAQDLNRAQRELMLACAKGGRFVAVGDRRQAINGFAGADCNSFDKIANLPNTIELPLSVCYRCGRRMIELAQEIVPEIQPRANANEGIVDSVNELTLDLFAPYEENGNKSGAMVLCRTSAPLVAMCLKLIRKRIPAIVKGRDIANGLAALIEKSKAKTIKGFKSWADVELEKVAKEVAKADSITIEEARESGRYIAFDDRIQCILAIGEDVHNLEQVKTTLDTIFSDDNIPNAVTFSTAHKAKGLQADKVVILLPNKLPLEWKGQKQWQFEQELNLKYVAVTRAKKTLTFVNVEQAALFKAEFDK